MLAPNCEVNPNKVNLARLLQTWIPTARRQDSEKLGTFLYNHDLADSEGFRRHSHRNRMTSVIENGVMNAVEGYCARTSVPGTAEVRKE